MEICKAPTLRLKVVNKHNTHNVQRDGKCYQQFTHNVDIKKGSSITVCKMHSHACMHTHTHTHTYTEWSLAVLRCYPLEFQQPSFYAKPDSLNPTPCLTLCYKQHGTPEEKLSWQTAAILSIRNLLFVFSFKWTPDQCKGPHTVSSYWVYVCLPVKCHLYIWQNDQAILLTTAVTITQGWNG